MQNHIAGFFQKELPAWKFTYQNSTSKIPYLNNKELPFINMIATRDPPWADPGEISYLTLVAHYDSKLEPEGFIGAMDSAAPCAMLMHVARSLESALEKKWKSMNEVGMKMEGYDSGLEEHQGLQIIFLDGEEAFGEWTDEDSIWGAKSLAADMESALHPALSTYQNALSSISLFMLLDLLGIEKPLVPSYFKTTHWAYKHLRDLADRLDSASKSETKAVSSWFPDFQKSEDTAWFGGGIGDDHQPFQERGVDVLHIIPSPFPVHIWHRIEDDGEHLDIPTCKDWAVLVTAFAAEWLDLEGYFDTSAKQARSGVGHGQQKRDRSEL